MTRPRPVVVLTAVVCLLTAGCSSADQVTLTVDNAVTLGDQPVHLKVTGLPAKKPVTIGADAVDHDGKKWHSEATFTADEHGTVDLDSAKPTRGSYQDADGMGLFWSMNPPDGDPDSQQYIPQAEAGLPVEHLDLAVTRDGKTIAGTTLTRRWVAPGVTIRQLTLAKDQRLGLFASPEQDGAKHPAVLLLGGSEGGLPSPSIMELLASHGYPTLALAYFHAAGLPQEIRDIPLEYFASAAQWLQRQPGVDPAHVVVMSGSYGTEAALLVADHFPDLVHGAVLFAPGASASNSYPRPDGYAWSYRGQPITRQVIPVGGVDGPVLAVAGGDDLLWTSSLAAKLIMQNLDYAGDKFPHEAVIVPTAGHGVSGTPYLPHGTHFQHPIAGLINLGGSRPANESALRQGWTKALALLSSLR